MLSIQNLRATARARLRDAEVLLSKRRYDGAVYLARYAVEIALKARIAKTLKWTGFPMSRGEFEGLQSLKTHDLQLLLRLTGREDKIKAKFAAEWLNVSTWNPESRYMPPGSTTPPDAVRMIECAKTLVGALT